MVKKKPTRNDVASKAGVSPAVVSYVLNGSNYVSDTKRRAVLTAIEELGYYPNIVARSLKTSRSAQIAFICDNITSNHWLPLIEERFYEKNYNVSLCFSKPTDEFLRMIVGRNFEGIFMMTNIYTADQLNSLAEFNIPIILYKTRQYKELDERIVTVAPNYIEGVKKSVDYLALKGHKQIGFVPPLRYITKGITGDDFRIRAYVESLEKHGLPVTDDLVCASTQSEAVINESVFKMVTAGQGISPTGLVVGNDYLAIEIMQYLKQLGRRVPEDIAIIGADNDMVASLSSPQLTTIDFSKDEFAETVSTSLIRLMRGEKVTPQEMFIDTRLIIRESA
ncbi:MAG: LacI family DNA-binding transcriptional regulator [Sphaerochaetaceae bacterium]|nr:LacI family DNA-binding transcriptional regulator [Sphaerochaetaceae bacterium]